MQLANLGQQAMAREPSDRWPENLVMILPIVILAPPRKAKPWPSASVWITAHLKSDPGWNA
jgi:hypothetical protein